MQIRICNNCEKKLERTYLRKVSLIVYGKEGNVLELSDADFCSYGCLEEFTETSLASEDSLNESRV